jgi:hypothetical protein
MDYYLEGPCDKTPSWTSIESYHDENDYWINIENAFRCKALKKMCKTDFLLTPLIIDNKECYSTKSGKFIIYLDQCHDILQVYGSNKLIYDIPVANSLMLEREELIKNIKEMKEKSTLLEKNKYDLSKVYRLDIKIESLYLKVADELHKNLATIKIWEERVINIKKELTNTFVDYISKNDCI